MRWRISLIMRVFELFDFKRLFSFSQEINFSDLRRQFVKKKKKKNIWHQNSRWLLWNTSKFRRQKIGGLTSEIGRWNTENRLRRWWEIDGKWAFFSCGNFKHTWRQASLIFEEKKCWRFGGRAGAWAVSFRHPFQARELAEDKCATTDVTSSDHWEKCHIWQRGSKW